jgi:hypothetical protein
MKLLQQSLLAEVEQQLEDNDNYPYQFKNAITSHWDMFSHVTQFFAMFAEQNLRKRILLPNSFCILMTVTTLITKRVVLALLVSCWTTIIEGKISFLTMIAMYAK